MPIQSFIEFLSFEKKASPHTIRAYQDDLITFKKFNEKEYPGQDLETINYQQVRLWIVEMVNQELTNRTINRKISSLKSFYKFLVKTKQIKKSPLTGHQALKISKRVLVPFSIDEINQVINNAQENDDYESLRNRLIVELFYSTGMRRAELIELKMDSINLENSTVKVLGKRNKERYIPLLNSVKETLLVYKDKKRELGSESEFLFLTKKGNKIYPTLVYRIINEYFSHVSSKVKKSPHVIRHSFATHLLNEGADLNSVKELLGHSSLASTQVYTHSSLNELKKVYNQAHPRSTKI